MYNVDRLKQQAEFLKAAEITTLCIFRSTPPNITKNLQTKVGFGEHTLSDRQGKVYKAFQLKGSAKAIFTGSAEISNNMDKYKKFISVSASMKETKGVKGLQAAKQLPADFLIDEDGVIFDVYRSTSPQDHIPFERLEAFVPEGKRCKCNKKDCISSHCRETYEEIRKDNEALFSE